MLRESASRLLVPIARNAMQRRCQSVVSGPPTKQISKVELYLLGSLVVIVPLIAPTYITYHIREYRGK